MRNTVSPNFSGQPAVSAGKSLNSASATPALLAACCVLLTAVMTSGRGLTPAADPLAESGGRKGAMADVEKLARLQQEGLNNMDDFMGSFELGQQATDDVKCGTTAARSGCLCHCVGLPFCL